MVQNDAYFAENRLVLVTAEDHVKRLVELLVEDGRYNFRLKIVSMLTKIPDRPNAVQGEVVLESPASSDSLKSH